MSNSSLKNKLESIIFSSKAPISFKSLFNYFSNVCNKNELMSALQDLENKKPLELHETLGHVVEMAAKLAVNLTVSPIYYQLIAGLDVMNRRC